MAGSPWTAAWTEPRRGRNCSPCPGIGPWTADYVALRVFGDPDAFPVGDLIVRRQAERLGLPGAEKALLAHAESWRPWRAYAALHLWAGSGGPVIEATEGTEQ